MTDSTAAKAVTQPGVLYLWCLASKLLHEPLVEDVPRDPDDAILNPGWNYGALPFRSMSMLGPEIEGLTNKLQTLYSLGPAFSSDPAYLASGLTSGRN